MKRAVISVVFILLIIIIVEEQVLFATCNLLNPRGRRKCYHQETKKTLYLGQSMSLEGQCRSITCFTGLVIIETKCKDLIPPKGCTNIIDYSKPYPACCSNIVCSKDFPHKCYDEETETILEAGESLSLEGQCVQITCHNGSYITGTTCTPESAPEGCKIDIDLTKPYPICCENFFCPGKKKT